MEGPERLAAMISLSQRWSMYRYVYGIVVGSVPVLFSVRVHDCFSGRVMKWRKTKEKDGEAEEEMN